MMLLLIEHELGATPFVDELCRNSAHRLVVCRKIDEAADICRRTTGEIDWIVVNGIQADADDLVRMLRATGCQAPIVFLSSEPSATGFLEESARAPSRRLTRLDIHRILTQPGGALEQGETLFEYHAPIRSRRRRIRAGEKAGDPVRSDSFSRKPIDAK